MRAPLRDAIVDVLRNSDHHGYVRHNYVSALDTWNPKMLFTAGEKGWFYDIADLDTQFTDFAGTLRVVNSGDAVACIKDKSGNGSDAKKATVAARPLLKFLPSSNRPYHDYDNGDDVLTNTVAVTLTGCTIIRIFANSVSITVNQTIAAGNSNRTLDNFGEIVVNRALTAFELAAVQRWGDNRRGANDEFVAYGADATNEKLAIFPCSGHPNAPIFIMTHGGGWRNGGYLLDNVTLNKFQHWMAKGITCVSVEYKLDAGTDPVTVQAPSVAKAIAYIQQRFPGRKVVICGHSAGAHLTCLSVSSDAIRVGAGVRPFAGMLLLDSAAYDVYNIMTAPGGHLALYDDPWGIDPNHWIAGSPARIMTSPMPPTMCVVSQTGGPHGEADAENTQEWVDLATSLGTIVTVRNTPLAHGDLNNFLGLPAPVGDVTYTADVDTWFYGIVGQPTL